MPLSTDHLARCIRTLESSLTLYRQAELESIDQEVFRNAIVKGYELAQETSFKLDAFGFGLAIEGERRFEGTNTAGEMIGAEGHGVGSNCPDSSESCRRCQSATQCGLITPDGGSHVSLSCVWEDRESSRTG